MISTPNLARQSLLSILCVGAIGVLGNALINNPAKSSLQEPAAFDFPPNVPLANVPMLASKPLAAYVFKNKMLANGRTYR
jgi:hypothetical protein